MPRRSGLELLEIAAQRQPQAVRVLLTGYADSLVDEKVAQWRLVDAWVSKPIDSAALKTSIAQAIEKETAIVPPSRRSRPTMATSGARLRASGKALRRPFRARSCLSAFEDERDDFGEAVAAFAVGDVARAAVPGGRGSGARWRRRQRRGSRRSRAGRWASRRRRASRRAWPSRSSLHQACAMRAHILALSWSPKKACACTDEVMQLAPAARMRAPMSSTVGGVAASASRRCRRRRRSGAATGRRRGARRGRRAGSRRRACAAVRRWRAARVGVVPGRSLDAASARRAAHGEGAVLGDGAGERPGAGEHLGPAGGASGDGDDAQPGGGGAREGVVGGGHERAVVGERVVDVAEDAAQPRRQGASSR